MSDETATAWKRRDKATEACLQELIALGDGDLAYECLANVCFNLFARAGWESGWPVFAERVAHGLEQRHLMDEPLGHA